MGRLLKGSWLERWVGRLWPLNMILTGVVALLVANSAVRLGGGSLESGVLIGLGAAVALASFRFPRHGGRLAAVLLLAAPVLWVLGAVAS